MTKKVKRRINFKGLIFLLLVLYLIGMVVYSVFTMPIKNIYIKGTKLLSDNEIIEVAEIKDYPSIFKVSSKEIEKKIKTLELVKDVKVTKKLNGKLVIEIDEALPLFYNRNTNKVVLSNHLEVDTKYVGIPTLINSMTKEMLTNFINAFSKIDRDIIKLINEIMYDPEVVKNPETGQTITTDEERFKLSMNDGNIVYVNIVNMKKLNSYMRIYSTLNVKGILLLDGYNETDVEGIFSAFEEGDSSNDGGED